jgi:hypothetical protein
MTDTRLGNQCLDGGLRRKQFYAYTSWGRCYLRALELWHYGLLDGPKPKPEDFRRRVTISHRTTLPGESTGSRRR